VARIALGVNVAALGVRAGALPNGGTSERQPLRGRAICIAHGKF